MESEYATELTLDDVARQIATSRRQLQRCLDEHGDTPFRQCLARIRMQRAAELLAETSIPVRDVAARVGYRSRRSSPRRSRACTGFRRLGTAPAASADSPPRRNLERRR